MRLRVSTGIVLALSGAPVLVAAEKGLTLADLSPGEEVRLRLSSGGKLRGTIEATGSEELVVRSKDPAQTSLRLSPQQMAKLEVVRGRRSHWKRGAAIGFVPGALFTGAAAVGLSECTRDCDHTGEALGYGLVGGLVTGSVGALIGLAVKTDRWVPVETRKPGVALTLAPAKGGFRAHLSLRF